MSVRKKLLFLLYKAYLPFHKSKINKNKYDMIISIYSSLSIPYVENYDASILSYKQGNLSVSSTSNLLIPYTEIRVNGKNKLLGIECWSTFGFRLEEKSRKKIRPLYLDKAEFIYWTAGGLYREDQNGVRQVCFFDLSSFMYCDMIKADDYYVLRSGGLIQYSKDLIHWKIIYNGKRGIKDSMITTGSGADLSLLFIEYSPGSERTNHSILRYSFNEDHLETVLLFYTHKDFLDKNLKPCARHIHVISKDPYTNDIYVGTGDNNDESGIYVSKDNGYTFNCLMCGTQDFRALSFVFTEHFVLWNTDTHESQAILRMDRRDVNKIERFPLINGALWCCSKYPQKIDGSDFYVMSSNSEGSLYDNNNRVYGMLIKDERPFFYELLKKTSRTRYSQQFLLGFDNKNNIYLYDHEIDMVTSYYLIG